MIRPLIRLPLVLAIALPLARAGTLFSAKTPMTSLPRGSPPLRPAYPKEAVGDRLVGPAIRDVPASQWPESGRGYPYHSYSKSRYPVVIGMEVVPAACGNQDGDDLVGEGGRGKTRGLRGLLLYFPDRVPQAFSYQVFRDEEGCRKPDLAADIHHGVPRP